MKFLLAYREGSTFSMALLLYITTLASKTQQVSWRHELSVLSTFRDLHRWCHHMQHLQFFKVTLKITTQNVTNFLKSRSLCFVPDMQNMHRWRYYTLSFPILKVTSQYDYCELSLTSQCAFKGKSAVIMERKCEDG